MQLHALSATNSINHPGNSRPWQPQLFLVNHQYNHNFNSFYLGELENHSGDISKLKSLPRMKPGKGGREGAREREN